MADWVKRDYGKGDIDRAGEFLALWWTRIGDPSPSPVDQDRLADAWIVAQNWRTSHTLPMNSFQVNLRAKRRRVEPNALVAQRLKRMSSVLNKLVREPKMKLSQMQDLGGCRAILSEVDAVTRLYELYRGGPQDLFESEGALKCYDYIQSPKINGYRGIHVVGRYRARLPKNEAWNGHRVEIQLRTKLQHAFATTVETVTTFTRHPLKFGGGPDEWRRFFALMGSALALREGTPPVDGTPQDRVELVRELRDRTKALKVRQRLAGWSRALRQLPRRNVVRFKWLLLVLDLAKNTINVTGFDDRQKAAEVLESIEKREGEGNLDAVLVWVRSIRDLKAAYPNYYADAGEFIKALNEAIKP